MDWDHMEPSDQPSVKPASEVAAAKRGQLQNRGRIHNISFLRVLFSRYTASLPVVLYQ